MKKIILLSVLTSSALLATNGDLMLSHGAKSTGMGGVAIAVAHGAESAYANPAMLKDVKSSEFDASLTLFMPDVKFQNDMNPTYTSEKSDADKSFLPELSYVHRNSDNVVWGVALGGTAGMGVDQVGKNSGGFSMKTELQVAKLGIPVAYTTGALTVAVEPVLQYSTLQINYQTAKGASANPKSSSTGFGVNIGTAYEVGDLTVGALYQSKIEADYKDNISSAMRDFGVATVTSGDRLDQPAEAGIGFGYKLGNSTFGVDAKRVQWSKAKGYKEFGWEDQNIYSIGYQYKVPAWAIRAGYNHAKSPVKELNGAATSPANYPNAAINFFNLAGFPAVVETHYTLGGDYAITENLDLSLAAVYSPEKTEKFDTSMMAAAQTAGAVTSSSAEVKHSQKAVTLGISYRY